MSFKGIIFKVIIILSNLFKENFSELVIIPLESSQKMNIGRTETAISFIDTILNTVLSTHIKIGTPEVSLKSFITSFQCYFGIKPSNFINNSTSEQKYNINKSETFKNITKMNKTYIYNPDDILAQEKFYFQTFNYTLNKYNEVSLDKIYFVLGVGKEFNISKIYSLYIGLKPDNPGDEISTSLIHQIKKNKIIDNYYFSFLYYYSSEKKNLFNNSFLINTKCDLIIGELPHKFKPDSFYENQLIKISTLKDDYEFYKTSWAIRFTKVFFYSKNNIDNNITFITDIKAFLSFHEYVITGTDEYNQKIEKDFFDDYKNDCFTNYSGDYLIYYCEKSNNFTIENLKSFPKLYFQHIELNYTFELGYEDLFIEKNEKFWFLVVFDSYTQLDSWFFGNLFLQKYNFTFDIENKIIGFYNPNLPKANNEKKDDEKDEGSKNETIGVNDHGVSYFVVICLIMVSGIVFIIVGIFIGKKILNKENKRKRANELDDNYDYNVSDDMNEPIINN